jgi:hypothetical protein
MRQIGIRDDIAEHATPGGFAFEIDVDVHGRFAPALEDRGGPPVK